MRLIAAALSSVLVFVPAARPSAPAPVLPAADLGIVRYSAPVAPLRVVRGFDPPATPYGPGHLGVDLASRSGQPVRAAADGVVSFAGPVAGRGLVVIEHPDGIRTEYEPIRPAVTRGAVVHRGEMIGLVAGTHGACAPGGCLHWGARRGEDYLDPLVLLQPLGPVRLLPWTTGRPARS
jgi:murein DD-endopeptidase MepM/ murein hydrolase activator NlpD